METNNKTTPITAEKDRNSISPDLMHRMRLHGMSAAFSESLQATFAETMTPDSFLNWLLSVEWDYRAARNIERPVKNANFRYDDASVAQIDYNLPRGPRIVIRWSVSHRWTLSVKVKTCSSQAVRTGKSYPATALGYEACKAGMRVLYANASKLMGTLKIAKTKEQSKRSSRNSKNAAPDPRRSLLVPLDAKERAHLTEIIEDRHVANQSS